MTTSKSTGSLPTEALGHVAHLRGLWGMVPLPAAGQVMTAPANGIRSAGDEEKEITAKIGQAEFALYHIGRILFFLQAG